MRKTSSTKAKSSGRRLKRFNTSKVKSSGTSGMRKSSASVAAVVPGASASSVAGVSTPKVSQETSGNPTMPKSSKPLTENEIEWLRALNQRSWKVHEPGPYDRTRYRHHEDLPIHKDDRTYLLDILQTHQGEFLFEPGSGVFGFGVALSVFLPKYGLYPGVPNEPEHLITVTSKQMFPDHRRAGETAGAYELFEKFTHTESNKKLRPEFGFKEPLKSYAYYDY